MDDIEQHIADELLGAIAEQEAGRRREQQTIIGISEIGTCREMVRRKLIQEDPSDKRLRLDAWVGTAIGEAFEQAVVAKWPDAKRQLDVKAEMPSGRWVLPGHPDLVWPKASWTVELDDGTPVVLGPLVLDGKTVDGFEMVERNGPSEQQDIQLTLYALGLWQSGEFGDAPIEKVKVANSWIDRSGSESRLIVALRDFSWETVYRAEELLDDSVYAAQNGEFASRDKPRQFCQTYCEYFSNCRGRDDTDVAGLIEDPETVSAIELYVEGQELAKAGEKKKQQAKAHLQGVSGNTATHAVRTVHVNESEVPGYVRKAYDKLDVRRLK